MTHKMGSLQAQDIFGRSVPALEYSYGTACQRVAVASASAQSAVFSATSDVVVTLTASVDCYYAVGADPTATANAAGSDFLPAGAKWSEIIPAGSKIAVIRASEDGEFRAKPSGS